MIALWPLHPRRHDPPGHSSGVGDFVPTPIPLSSHIFDGPLSNPAALTTGAGPASVSSTWNGMTSRPEATHHRRLLRRGGGAQSRLIGDGTKRLLPIRLTQQAGRDGIRPGTRIENARAGRCLRFDSFVAVCAPISGQHVTVSRAQHAHMAVPAHHQGRPSHADRWPHHPP